LLSLCNLGIAVSSHRWSSWPDRQQTAVTLCAWNHQRVL